MAEEEERNMLKRHDTTWTLTQMYRKKNEGICGNTSTACVLMYNMYKRVRLPW